MGQIGTTTHDDNLVTQDVATVCPTDFIAVFKPFSDGFHVPGKRMARLR